MSLIQEQAGSIPVTGQGERVVGNKGEQSAKLPGDGVYTLNTRRTGPWNYYQESTRRSIVKSLSYRCLGVLVTGSIALLVTNELKVAATIGLIDTVVKIGGYFFHERIWNRIDYGRPKPPEYEI